MGGEKMNELRHVMILASAGSGKTYALTNRYIELLSRGAAPERIVALTFTRKAAGEFFDEILNKLARAAREPVFAERLGRDLEQPQLGPKDFLRMLRAVVDVMHRLRLGTLDSFFARIARAFPFELGLTGDFELLEENTARFERRRVLDRMFARAGELSAAQHDFIEAFKRATFGSEEKRLGSRLEAYLDEHQEVYLAAPVEKLWGMQSRIWPAGCFWLAPAEKNSELSRALRSALGKMGMTPGQQQRWDAFFDVLSGWSPGAPLPAPMEYILKNALAVWPTLRAGRAEMTVERRKQLLEGEPAAALVQLVTHIVGGELSRQIAATRGIFAVLRGYETIYHETVRRAGKLTFADVQRILLPSEGAPALAQGNQDISDDADPRLLIDYRLDGEIDHWLLDEFQDTSFGQWAVLRNLIDEAVQDASGARSFFCVGDVKQAIYAWREGDHRLFREIFNHYNQASPGTFTEQHLLNSWRSGPAIIEMVNRVFGADAVLRELFPGDASEVWNREWREHSSAFPQRTGQAALLHADNESERWRTALRLLQELRPLERGLSCAVLVQKNETARELADFLRREGKFAAVAESDLRVCTDNVVGTALLALLQTAAHPGDTLSWEHVWMTPLATVLTTANLVTREAVTGFVLKHVHAEGFERFWEFWLGKLAPHFALDDAFNRERARQLTAAAAGFDATGSRNISEFIQFMERHVIRGSESAAVIRVMTVHKAKGLGFDVVILPDLEGIKLARARDGLAVHKAPDRSVDWILALPSKLFWQQDEVLAEHMRIAEAEACYEKLSLLYVAMTRAKRAMYAIIEPVAASKSHNYPRLLSHTLGLEAGRIKVGDLAFPGVWTSGDSAWHRSIPTGAGESVSERKEIQTIPLKGEVVRRHAARRPSSEKAGELAAAQLFSLERNASADFGTEVHELFSAIEWTEDIEPFAAAMQTRGVTTGAWTEARACLCDPALNPVWARPRAVGRAEVWRERAFEVVLEGAWVTGVFDRVVIERDNAGAALRATVFDFKTDRVAEGPEEVAGILRRYGGQLNLYRKVAAVLLGLASEAIACELVLTKLRRRVAIPMGGSR
jgi:ATP-dependent helicase/nuclease subunit A